jgi:uncharacterized membrane protein
MKACVTAMRFIQVKMFNVTALLLAVDVIAILFSFVTCDIYERKNFLFSKNQFYLSQLSHRNLAATKNVTGVFLPVIYGGVGYLPLSKIL